ncbi:MAG: OsmC family protein [bacterium]|nr:OsmC family protein [bacterium]
MFLYCKGIINAILLLNMDATKILKVEVGNLKGKMQLTGKGHSASTVAIDYPSPLGEDNGFTPMELLMISLAGCSIQTIQYILGKSGVKIDDIKAIVTGQRRMNEHATILTRIELEYQIMGNNLNASAIEKAIKAAEEKICPVWAMLDEGIEIEWKYTIN